MIHPICCGLSGLYSACHTVHSFRWIPYEFLWNVMVERISGITMQQVHLKVFHQLYVLILDRADIAESIPWKKITVCCCGK